MRSLLKCVAAMACLFGMVSAAAQAGDEGSVERYARHPSMTMSGGAMTWMAKLPSDQSSTIAMRFQTALAAHLQSVIHKDLVFEASVKVKPSATEVKIELAETAGPTVFPKGIEAFKVEKSCDSNTTISVEGSADLIAKLKDPQSTERKMLDVQLVKFAQFAHWLPLVDAGSAVTVQIVPGETKTSLTFDVMFAEGFIKQQSIDRIPYPQAKKAIASASLGL